MGLFDSLFGGKSDADKGDSGKSAGDTLKEITAAGFTAISIATTGTTATPEAFADKTVELYSHQAAEKASEDRSQAINDATITNNDTSTSQAK